jgi:hypothetical protein
VKTPVAAISLLTISAGLLAQAPVQVFTSPQGDFRFAYSPPLVRCARNATQPSDGGAWLPESWCRNDVCQDQALPSDSTVACLAYAGDEYSKKVAFGAGAFFVAEVEKAATEKLCLQGDAGWTRQSIGISKFTDEPSAQFRTTDRWMMHSRDSVIDRVFHRGTCYEIGIQRVHNNTEPYDPGSFEEFTARDEATVQHRLRQALQSFRFLN